jgi:hypothetical protein
VVYADDVNLFGKKTKETRAQGIVDTANCAGIEVNAEKIINTVACRPVAGQRSQNKQIYVSRY